MNSTTVAAKSSPVPFAVGMRVRIEKGCAAREVVKNGLAEITEVTALGADYSHMVKVALRLLNGRLAGKQVVFYARHVNRLNDAVLGMNDGNPGHRIEITRAH